MKKDYKKEVADIHQEISNSQGKLFRLLDKMIIEKKDLERKVETLELQLKAKETLLNEKDEKIEEQEEELEAYRLQVEEALYEQSKETNRKSKKVIQHFHHVDQMAVGDSATLNRQYKPLEEAV